jgi:hypothetical protein
MVRLCAETLLCLCRTMHLSPCHLCAGERLQLDGQENAIGIGSRQDILNVLLRGGSASASAGSNTNFTGETLSRCSTRYPTGSWGFPESPFENSLSPKEKNNRALLFYQGPIFSCSQNKVLVGFVHTCKAHDSEALVLPWPQMLRKRMKRLTSHIRVTDQPAALKEPPKNTKELLLLSSSSSCSSSLGSAVALGVLLVHCVSSE